MWNKRPLLKGTEYCWVLCKTCRTKHSSLYARNTHNQWRDCVLCRKERVEGGSGPDQDEEQQAQEAEGEQGGEGGGQGGPEEQGELGQDCKVLMSWTDSLKFVNNWLKVVNYCCLLYLFHLGAASLERRKSGASSLGRSSSHSPLMDSSLHMETLVR